MQDEDYSQLEQALQDMGADKPAAELHGILLGHLCAGASSSGGRATYEGWLGDSLPPDLVKLLDDLRGKAQAALDEFADFDFRLLIPDDQEDISGRMLALAQWCAGFVIGLGDASGRHSEVVVEALEDMSRIAAFSEEVPASEENESDFMELEEFVRVSTLLIYAELQDGNTRRANAN